MISVIVYGRNDAHGYNLHKRAALSLNCIAQLLSDPSDEILFVDYNTPDDLPTFPEAIGDTLTEAARERLTVIRVRPAHHAPIADQTHLVAVEPIARNVALRRCNPANRWVLSTNTDMIFVPRDPADDLTTVFSQLADGFYHLPRFELPESLWESFDRGDPDQAIARTHRWADRFHLNEVVHASQAILYDGPGDFQLALREDLFGIDGFDERMLLGWHLDSNLARRMRLLRGRIGDLADRLAGYHCDHTRQATLAHRRGHLQNDWEVFVEEIWDAGLPAQADTWGLAGAALESFKLGQGSGSRYFQALDRVLDPAGGAIYQGYYTASGYDDLSYAPEHALPYVLDLLSSQPPSTRIGYAGARGDTLRLIAEGVKALMPQASITVLEEMDWLGAHALDLPTALWPRWSAEADLYIFELGEPDPARESVDPETCRARNAAVVSAFWRLGQEEAQGRRPRVLAINAVNNAFEPIVNAVLNCTPTPFGTRVRHGYIDHGVQARRPADLSVFADWLAARTGRFATPPSDEVKRLLEDAVALAQSPGSDHAAWWRGRLHAGSVLALMQHPDFPAVAGVPASQVDQAQARLAAGRPSNAVQGVTGGLAVGPGASLASSRLANAEDWEAPAFLKRVIRHFGGAAGYGLHRRSVSVWERAGLLMSAEPLLADSDAGARALFVADGPDSLALALSSLGATVETCSPAVLLGQAAAEPGAPPYDLIVASGNVLANGGAERFGRLIEQLDVRLRPGGRLLFSTLVRLDGGVDGESLPRAVVQDGRFAREFSRVTDYDSLGEVDIRASLSTLDRTSRLGLEQDIFVHDLGDGYRTLAVWAWTKSGARAVDTEGLISIIADAVASPQELLIAHGLVRLQPGETVDITHRMAAKADVHEGDDGWRVEPGSTLRHSIYGPYVRLPAGRYAVYHIVSGVERADSDKLIVVLDAVIDNGSPLAVKEYALLDGGGREALRLEFVIDRQAARGRLEVRLSHSGRASFLVKAVRLERIG